MPTPSDTTIISWQPDYGGADTNSPVDSDIIGPWLDDQLRNIKSVNRAECLSKQWERWRGLYGTLTVVSSTQFTLTGDRRFATTQNPPGVPGPCDTGRRIRALLTDGSFLYGTISAVALVGMDTQVDVTMDAGGLPLSAPTVSEIQFGVITVSNTSVPPTVTVLSDNVHPYRAALVAGTATVIFSPFEPNTTYFVALGGDTDENFFDTSRTPAGFVLNSSNGSSTASVDVIVVRNGAQGLATPTTLLISEGWES